MKPKIAIIRGKFLNAYEMQFFEPLTKEFDITAFGSRTCFHTSFTFPVKTLLSPMDIPDFPLKMPIINRMFIDGQYLFGLEQQLVGYDLVHSAEMYYHYTQQALHAKKRGRVKKVIATVLENIPFNNEGIWGRQQFKRQARHNLDHIIALTERTKNALVVEGADDHKITVIPHFIDTNRFTWRTTTQERTSLTILFSGRLEIYKGVYEILYAAYQLLNVKKISTPLTFIFVGDGSEKVRMIEMEKHLGIETHVRHVTSNYADMPQWYQKADIYVAPSKSSGTWVEQYNTTLLEAQAAGLPIITTWSGGIPENVGNAAILIPPDDSYALTNAIQSLIESKELRIKFSKKARERAVRVHDISIGAKKIRDVWLKTLASS